MLPNQGLCRCWQQWDVAKNFLARLGNLLFCLVLMCCFVVEFIYLRIGWDLTSRVYIYWKTEFFLLALTQIHSVILRLSKVIQGFALGPLHTLRIIRLEFM